MNTNRIYLIALLAAFVALYACSKKSPTEAEPAGPTVSVLVSGYVCAADSAHHAPYARVTGGVARVTLVDSLGQFHSAQTNAESAASLTVSSGWYRVIVEPDLGYPVSLDSLYVDRDTSIHVQVHAPFMTPDTVAVVFGSGPGFAPRILPDGAYRKRIVIESITNGNLLDTTDFNSWPSSEIRIDSVAFFQYLIPVADSFSLWRVHDHLTAWDDGTQEIAYAGAYRMWQCRPDSGIVPF